MADETGETEAERKRRLARERKAARALARKGTEEKWRAQVEAHFHFLQTEFGYQITSMDASSGWETVLIYQSANAAVKVARSVEYNRAELTLIRLVDGELPGGLVFFLPDSVLNQTLLDNLIRRRAPQLMERLHKLEGLEDAQVDATLAFCASAAREYIPDVLRGDFTIFDEIQEERRQYAREHPPIVTIWAPPDASDEEIAQMAQRSQEPGVVVQVRRYQPPANSAAAPKPGRRSKK